MTNKNTTWAHSVTESDGLSYGYEIDLVTRKIRFQYDASKDMSFDFSLLSEVGENWQIPMKQLLEEDGITLGIYDGDDDYCNVVTEFKDFSCWES
jgi:hypothetical protein